MNPPDKPPPRGRFDPNIVSQSDAPQASRPSRPLSDYARLDDSDLKSIIRFADGEINLIKHSLLRHIETGIRGVSTLYAVPGSDDCRWIPITDGIPDKGAECLLRIGNIVKLDHWDGSAFKYSFYSGPHQSWMPLENAIGEDTP